MPNTIRLQAKYRNNSEYVTAFNDMYSSDYKVASDNKLAETTIRGKELTPLQLACRLEWQLSPEHIEELQDYYILHWNIEYLKQELQYYNHTKQLAYIERNGIKYLVLAKKKHWRSIMDIKEGTTLLVSFRLTKAGEGFVMVKTKVINAE